MDELKQYLDDYKKFEDDYYRAKHHWKNSYDAYQDEIFELELRLDSLKRKAFEIKDNGERTTYIISQQFYQNHEDREFSVKVCDLLEDLSDNLGVSLEEISATFEYLDNESYTLYREKEDFESRVVCLNIRYLDNLYCYFWRADLDEIMEDNCSLDDVLVSFSYSSIAKGVRIYESDGGEVFKNSIINVYQRQCKNKQHHLVNNLN